MKVIAKTLLVGFAAVLSGGLMAAWSYLATPDEVNAQATAESAPVAHGAPQAVLKEKTFDFGTVSQGSVVKHDFIVRNTGSADLVIQRIIPACGCTAAQASTNPIPPGGEQAIHVQFDTAGFSGEKLKTVRVQTNDINNLSLVLSLKGVVEPDVLVEPQSVFFDKVVRGSASGANTKVVTISVREGAATTISGVKTFASAVRVVEREATPRKRVLEVTIDSSAPLGELRDRVIIGLSGGKESTINIPVFAVVQGQLSLSPAQLSFGVIEGSEPIVRSVKFENSGPQPVTIKEIRSNHPAVSTSFKEAQAGKNYVVRIVVDPTKVKKDLRTAVEVITDSAQEGSLSLSLFGILPPKA